MTDYSAAADAGSRSCASAIKRFSANASFGARPPRKKHARMLARVHDWPVRSPANASLMPRRANDLVLGVAAANWLVCAVEIRSTVPKPITFSRTFS